MKNPIKYLIINTFLISGLVIFLMCTKQSKTENVVVSRLEIPDQDPEKNPENNTNEDNENKIQVALLLDTSGSMDGLIEQAKTRLWNIVNTLTTLKYDGKAPNIEIALYEYGNDKYSAESNYIQQITPLTQDLDLISEKLFALTTNGGEEYCGAVISNSTKNLNWSNDTKSMKLIYIAGNEPFNQGNVNYKEAISAALKSKIYVNTIFCGNRKEGIDTFWMNGAELGQGKYFNIDSNQKVIYIETPYDDKIDKCNEKLNSTYLSYGRLGNSKKENQITQDNNAGNISKSNKIERAVSKSKANAYKNESWDLVDKAEKDDKFIEVAKDEELPAELKGKTVAEKKQIIKAKTEERTIVQKEIEQLAKDRQKFIDEETKKRAGNQADDLGKAIEKSILEIASKNGFTN